MTADSESYAATEAAGFRPNTPNKCAFTGFYYGLIDEYAYAMLFREPQFYFWISPSGGATLRNPAWDYGIRTGPMTAGTTRTFHARLVCECRLRRGHRAGGGCLPWRGNQAVRRFLVRPWTCCGRATIRGRQRSMSRTN